MNYFSIQNLNIPCTFITGLSYAKQAETVQNARGFNRFQRMGTSEISVRVNVSRAICLASSESFSRWDGLLSNDLVTRGSEPTNAFLAGNPLYSELLFAITSMTRTNVYDEIGELVSFECDLTLSGVSPAKDSARTKALIFTEINQAEIPDLTITANNKTLVPDDKTVLTSFILSEKACDLSIAFQDGSKTVSRDALVGLMNDYGATITINGYGVFHIIQADLIEDELSLKGSVFPVEWNQVETFSKTNTSLLDIFEGWSDDSSYILTYIHSHETRISLMKHLSESLGLLVDYENKSFHKVPEKLSSTVDIQAYVNEDVQTEKITKVIWWDHVHQFTTGNDDGATIKIDSCCVVDDDSVSKSCLKYVQFMQNSIKITLPYDKNVRLFSVINIIKNAKKIPAMITHYEIDFMSNEMIIEAGYLGD